jgi:hypothetical protein
MRLPKLPKPPALTAREQIQRGEERFAVETEATSRRMALARDDHENRFDRLRKRASDLGITRADDLGGLAPLLKIQRALKGGIERIQAELDLLDIERYLARSGTASSRRENLKARRDMRKAQLKITEPPAPPVGDLPVAVQKALETLDKNAAAKRPASHENRLAELQIMQTDFEDGLRELRTLIEEIKSSASYDEAMKLKARHEKLHLSLFRAEQRYSELAAEERELREALVHAGYVARSDLLPAPATLNVTLLLGSESDWHSTISAHRRSLESRGIL